MSDSPEPFADLVQGSPVGQAILERMRKVMWNMPRTRKNIERTRERLNELEDRLESSQTECDALRDALRDHLGIPNDEFDDRIAELAQYIKSQYED